MPISTADRALLIRRLVGARYRERARGPEEFDCWGLFAYARPRLCGDHPLPLIDVDPARLPRVARAFADPALAVGWGIVPTGEPFAAPDGAAMILARGDVPHHIGLWLAPERLCLHCCAAQHTVAETISHLRASHWRITRVLTPET